MTRSIVVCTTCKFPDGRKTDEAGRTAGELLAAELCAMAGDVSVETQACLWNCTKSCSVVFRDSDRFSYVTGGHEPSAEQAKAILEWFNLHGETDAGEVPFKLWPNRMRGHFIARIPPGSP